MLAAQGANRVLFDLPATQSEFAARVGRPGFRLPMLCLRDSEPVGVGATANRSQVSLNVRLKCFFAQPARAVLPLAAYVRHLFWSLPLHRVYTQFPVVTGAEAYVRLFTGAGFQEEGIVRGHALVEGHPRDLAVLGVLRGEFEAWCRENSSHLIL